jgi:hypothetical protein
MTLLVFQQIDWLSQETSEYEAELNMWYKLLEKYAVQVDDYITATNTLTSQTDTTGGKLIVPNLTAVHLVSCIYASYTVQAVLLYVLLYSCVHTYLDRDSPKLDVCLCMRPIHMYRLLKDVLKD